MSFLQQMKQNRENAFAGEVQRRLDLEKNDKLINSPTEKPTMWGYVCYKKEASILPNGNKISASLMVMVMGEEDKYDSKSHSFPYTMMDGSLKYRDVEYPECFQVFSNSDDIGHVDFGFGVMMQNVKIKARGENRRNADPFYLVADRVEPFVPEIVDPVLGLIQRNNERSFEFAGMDKGDSFTMPVVCQEYAEENITDDVLKGGLIAVLQPETIQFAMRTGTDESRPPYPEIRFGAFIGAPTSDVQTILLRDDVALRMGTVHVFGISHMDTLEALTNVLVRNSSMVCTASVYMNKILTMDGAVSDNPAMSINTRNFVVNLKDTIQRAGVKVTASTAKLIVDRFNAVYNVVSEQLLTGTRESDIASEDLKEYKKIIAARERNQLNRKGTYMIANLCEFMDGIDRLSVDPFLEMNDDDITFYAITNSGAETEQQVLDSMDGNESQVVFAVLNEPMKYQMMTLKRRAEPEPTGAEPAEKKKRGKKN